MALYHGSNIHESQSVFVLVDRRGRYLAGHDLAEYAIVSHFALVAPRGFYDDVRDLPEVYRGPRAEIKQLKPEVRRL
jgi:hypothetical protein